MATEESQKPTVPLPPGLVPSQSQEEFVFTFSPQHHRHDVLKDADLSENGSAEHGVLGSEHPPKASGSPPEAWMSPDRHADSSMKKKVTTFDTTGTKQYDPSSSLKIAPKHSGIDFHKEVVLEGNGHPAPTFKGPMSPFRRVNKVAPSSAKPLVAQQDRCNLQSKRMGNLKENQESLSGPQHTCTSSTPSRVSPVVEPVYSTVVKTKSHKKTPQSPIPPTSSDLHGSQTSTTMEPNVIAVLPKLECYETQNLDNSLVIVNNSTAEYEEQSQQGHESPPPIPPYMEHEGEEDDTVIYEEIDRPGVNSAMYKELKKHQDVGNVQLVSVRSISDLPQSQSMNFPNGSSTDMQSIHYAAANGNKKALAEILSALPVEKATVERVLGSDRMCRRQGIDVRDSEGRTALMHAVHNNHIECVKLLAKQGASVNGTAEDGSTPLHKTAYSGTLEMLALLLNLGANGLLRDKDGRTPLHWCTNNPDPECIKILLDKVPSLDVNVLDASLMTPLMWAAFHGKPENINVLKEQGADQSLHDVDGMTAIHWSVQRHDTKALQALITMESSEFTDHIGKTVMHQTAEQGCARAVSLIQAIRPTSVNDVDANGRTPLHWATVCENPDVIRALLAHGADPLVKDSSDCTPLDYATEKGLHYCGLLLAKAEQSVDYSDQSYHISLTCGTSVETIGARAPTQQNDQLQTCEESLTKEQVVQIQGLYAGAWMNKFTKSGKGPLHPRLFWVEPENKICWTKDSDKLSKDTRKEYVVGVRSSASPTVIGRKDFEPLGQHKYAFTILTATRVLDVVAVSSEDYKIWLNGLQLLLDIGGTNATRLLTSSAH